VIEVIGVTKVGFENRRNLCVQDTVHHIEQQFEHHRAFRAAAVLPYGTRFRLEDLRDELRPIIPYPTGRIFRGNASLALRAKLRSIVPTGRKSIHRAEALIKIALIGFNPGYRPSKRCGPKWRQTNVLATWNLDPIEDES
jgi:hypothetical protein